MQLKTKAGLSLFVLAIGIFGAWNWWTKTRNFVPLTIPMPLAAGQNSTSTFKLNFDALYLIEIHAQNTISLDELHCLMGADANPAQCKNISSVVAANWTLSRDGRELKRGSSAELHSAPAESEGISRVIGEFQGKAGEEYTLQVRFNADSSSLAAAKPHLRVAVASMAYTDLQSARVLMYSAVLMCLLFGAILLGIACFAKRRA